MSDQSLNESWREHERKHHERIEIETQRWCWENAATALRLLLEDDEASRMLREDSEPVLRTIENALDLDEDERTTETFDD